MTEIVNVLLLIIGFLFTFLVPGLYIIETFFPKLPKRFKLPLYLVLSVMVSTYLVYFVSLLLGFSRFSIIVSFSFFVPWIFMNFAKTIRLLIKTIKIHKYAIIFSVLVFTIYLIALYPGIFTLHDGFIVMSSSNWQDTAMHSGIIESISQGNFPPQAPYFSGVPLSYYYFTDFHSSILETLFGNFFPRIIVYDNPLFAIVFFLAVYALTLEVSKNKIISIFSSLASTFYGSFMYLNFFRDLFKQKENNLLITAINLLKNNSYAIEFGKFFQISPMADYFLQNRPMMVGLPAVIICTSLVIYNYKNNKYQWMILPGIISAMLLKFQFFAFALSVLVFLIISILYFNTKKIKLIIISVLLFIFMPLVFIFFFSATKINNISLFEVIATNFRFGPWEEGKSIFWYITFLIGNLGLPILLFIFSIPILIIVKKINYKSWIQVKPIIIIGFLIILIPLVSKFTIMKYDMLKFYYFGEIFLTIISFWFLFKVFGNKIVTILLSVFLLILIVPTSFTNLSNSYLNKTMAYTLPELEVGYWIRENTKQKSVFLDLANLHSPISEIGGRLRVLSYINWPHSHGFNVGDDNVFSRLEDIRNVYRNADKPDFYRDIISKYKINYIYCGLEERREFPTTCELLNHSKILKKVYDNKDVLLFKVI